MGLIELTATEQLKPIRLFSLSCDFMDIVSPRVSPNLNDMYDPSPARHKMSQVLARVMHEDRLSMSR